MLFVEIIGFLCLTRGGQFGYIGVITIRIGVFSLNALILSWVTCNIGGQTKRAMALAVISAFRSTGAAFSAWIYFNRLQIYNEGNHYTVVGILFFNIVSRTIVKTTVEVRKQTTEKYGYSTVSRISSCC